MPRTIQAEEYVDDLAIARADLNGDGTVTLYTLEEVLAENGGD